MPRSRRHARRRSALRPQPSPRAVALASSLEMSATESEGTLSPSSAVCNDYYQNLLSEGLALLHDSEPEQTILQAGRGLRSRQDIAEGYSPDWSLCDEPTPRGATNGKVERLICGEECIDTEVTPISEEQQPGIGERGAMARKSVSGLRVEELRSGSESVFTAHKLSLLTLPSEEATVPSSLTSNTMGHGSATATGVESALSADAAPFIPYKDLTLPTPPAPPAPHSSETAAAAVTAALVSLAQRELPPPSPAMEACTPAERADWTLVETHTLLAFRHFKAHAQPAATYTCPPMPGAKARLAMHRAAEVLGCRSMSNGEGRERRVVLTWTKDGMFPIKELSVILAVRVVLAELFTKHRVSGRKGRKGDTSDRAKKRETRKSRRKEERLEAAVEIADRGVDPTFVDLLVERGDWQAIQGLYDGVKVPGLNKKKKKAKRKAKANAGGGMLGQGQSMSNELFRPPGFGLGCPPAHLLDNDDFGQDLYPRGTQSFKETRAQGSQPGRRKGGHTGQNAAPLEGSNKGFAMLEKMGWRQGEGLGTSKEGMREPLQAQLRHKRSGLGSGTAN